MPFYSPVASQSGCIIILAYILCNTDLQIQFQFKSYSIQFQFNLDNSLTEFKKSYNPNSIWWLVKLECGIKSILYGPYNMEYMRSNSSNKPWNGLPDFIPFIIVDVPCWGKSGPKDHEFHGMKSSRGMTSLFIEFSRCCLVSRLIISTDKLVNISQYTSYYMQHSLWSSYKMFII